MSDHKVEVKPRENDELGYVHLEITGDGIPPYSTGVPIPSRGPGSPVRLEMSLAGIVAQVGIVLVDQTRFGGEDGNCLAACLATLLRLDINEVPGFFSDDEGTWREKMGAWLVARGWGHLCITGAPPKMLGPALSIVSGKSPRGDWLHATVWRGCELLHDPHPSRAGLVGEPVDTIVLVPLA